MNPGRNSMLRDEQTGQPGTVFELLFRGKLVVLAFAILSAAIAYAVTFRMIPAYRAEVLLSPIAEGSQAGLLAAIGGQLGGLGGLVGAGLGADSRVDERIATLTSRALASRFIADQSLVQVFCDDGVIACTDGRSRPAAATEEEANQALRLFTRRVLAVSEDKRSGLVRVSITWRDKRLAADWANRYVKLANQDLQERAIAESERRIQFLRDAAEKTQAVELRAAMYRLAESEIKSVMIATTRPDFAFRVVDPALVPDETARVRPRRALLAVAGAFLGFLLAAGFLIIAARYRAPGIREGAPQSAGG